MSAYDLLSRRPDVADDELPDELSGVLCRCTGYRNILAAVADVAHRHRDSCPGRRRVRGGCCSWPGGPGSPPGPTTARAGPRRKSRTRSGCRPASRPSPSRSPASSRCRSTRSGRGGLRCGPVGRLPARRRADRAARRAPCAGAGPGSASARSGCRSPGSPRSSRPTQASTPCAPSPRAPTSAAPGPPPTSGSRSSPDHREGHEPAGRRPRSPVGADRAVRPGARRGREPTVVRAVLRGRRGAARSRPATPARRPGAVRSRRDRHGPAARGLGRLRPCAPAAEPPDPWAPPPLSRPDRCCPRR